MKRTERTVIYHCGELKKRLLEAEYSGGWERRSGLSEGICWPHKLVRLGKEILGLGQKFFSKSSKTKC
jgi:hypothetical protein